MALCDNINIKIETPFIIYGRNYTGQFVSRIYVTDKIESLRLADEGGLFNLELDASGAYYNLYIYRCSLINVQSCQCPVVNELQMYVNDGVGPCTFPIYTVIPGHVRNAATEANAFGKQLVLDFNMLPVLDSSGRTPCDEGFDSSSVGMSDLLEHFHVLFETDGDKSVVEHASFETRFCQMFWQSVKIPARYNVNEMFAAGDVLTMKCKVGVDEFGNDIYHVIDKSAIYKDGVKETGPIVVKRVQKDNTLTLERPVDTSAIDMASFSTKVIPKGAKQDYVDVGKSSVKGVFDQLTPLYVVSKGNIRGKSKFYVDGIPVGSFGKATSGKVTIGGTDYRVWKVSFDSTVSLNLDSSIGMNPPNSEQFTTLLVDGRIALARNVESFGMLAFPVDKCHNDFVVEATRSSCTELTPYDGVSEVTVPVYELDLEQNQIRIPLVNGMFPTDSNGREVCGKSRIVLSGKGCGEAQPSYRVDFPIIRYVYDGATADGKYTTGANCVYASPIKLTTDANGGNSDGGDDYGKDMYVKLREPDSCCSMRYLSVKLKYNEYLPSKYGELTLNGIKLRENDLVWLTSQYVKASDDGKSVDENGLWTVRRGEWEYYGDVTEDTFIDLGARVIETVSATVDYNVGRRTGTYWLGNIQLKSGMVVNLQNQSDGKDGLYRITCGEWKYIGTVGPYDGDNVDMSNDIVTYNDIDFCKCGIYHIWYYYLNGSCVLNTATRTVKVIGKCGKKEASLVPGKRIRITDYQVKTEVDKDLMPGSNGDPLVDECVSESLSFDKQYRFDVEDVVDGDDCLQDAVLPNCGEGVLCDHEYSAFSRGEEEKYNSGDSAGFSIVFWQAALEDDHVEYWTMYALVGRTSKNPKEYVAYRLRQSGSATVDMVEVTDWFELLPVSYDDGVNSYFRPVPITDAKPASGTISFDVPRDGFVDDVRVGDVLNVSNGNPLEEKMRATVVRIDDGVATADVSLPAEFDPSGYYAEIYRHKMVGDGVEIIDPSWVFGESADYPLTMKLQSDRKHYILTVPQGSPLDESATYYAYSNMGGIRPIPFVITGSVRTDDKITYDVLLSHDVPTYDVVSRQVDDGELVETVEQKVYPIRVSVGNSLTWRTIGERWSIRSNTTKIRIPKSYDFRFYNAPITVQEFVDLYNATKPQCVYPFDGEIIITDDSTDNTGYWIKDIGNIDGDVWPEGFDGQCGDESVPYVVLMDSIAHGPLVCDESDPEGGAKKYVAVATDGYINPRYEA